GRDGLGGVGGLVWFRTRRRLTCGLDRLWPAIKPIPEGAQDRSEILARGARERSHRLRDDKAASVEGAWRLLADTVAPGQCRTNQVRKPLQDIDTNRAFATHPIPDGAVELLVGVLVGGERRAAARRQPLQLIESLDVGAPVLERPQLRRNRSRPRLEQSRHVDMVGPKPHAVPAQPRTP